MLTTRQADNIAASAMALRDRLTARGASINVATNWVQAAMLGIVMAEVDEPDPPRGMVFGEAKPAFSGGDMHLAETDPDEMPPDLPDWPTAEQEAAKQEQLRAGQARWGNVTPGDTGIHPGVLQLLAIGPLEGQELRLVIVREVGSPARAAALRWVQENVPEAGRVISTSYAGKAESGDPVYLVTYELKAPGGPAHPVRYSDKPLG